LGEQASKRGNYTLKGVFMGKVEIKKGIIAFLVDEQYKNITN